ncbi:TetR family transcriptional regulator [Jiangella alba]|uniref:DNA-binding transcriptional regulator, AcrR family n=1 Tax=Jiangella alba TaxID=561176 RepID=A0A1H5PYU5_9ACTN|nr:TetR family transcriptional regulator [Jiangella alba]SEF18361.1 DNA-binding transcriptional regulator, AcrR family [Jiangella alba]
MSSVDSPDPEARPNRQGRWRSGQESKRRILDAARVSFAANGYQRATVRSIAADAEVDPAMIHYFFGRKDQLFAAVMSMADSPREPIGRLLADGLDGFGARLVRRFLEVWDATERVEPLLIMARSADDADVSAMLLREFIDQEFTAQLVAALDTPDAALRCDLVCAQLLGVAVARYSLQQEPLASAGHDTLVAWLGPIVQGLLTGPPPSDATRG